MHVERAPAENRTPEGKKTVPREEPPPEEDERAVLRAKDVARKIPSLQHFAHLYEVKAGYYLPPRYALSWRYVHQVLTGKKKLVRASEVGHPVSLPRFRGLQIEREWRRVQNVGDFATYFPDIPRGNHVPREYFLNVRSEGDAHRLAGPVRRPHGARQPARIAEHPATRRARHRRHAGGARVGRRDRARQPRISAQ